MKKLIINTCLVLLLSNYSEAQSIYGLIAPNGGEIYPVGKVRNIEYSVLDNNPYKFSLDYSIDSGKTWKSIVKGIEPTKKNANGNYYYKWTVPRAYSKKCLVRIYDNYNNDLHVSDSVFTIEVTNTVEEIDLGKEGVKLYPNPVLDQLNFTGAENYSSLAIFNMEGQQVMQQRLKANSGLDISILKKGMYLIGFYDDSGLAVTSARFIKN